MFTDRFIKRPVLASVISLLILLFGLHSIFNLPLREFPKTENTVITITTSYPGADATTMKDAVTSIIEKSISGADGIDYITAQSTQGSSVISAHIKLNFNPNTAFTNISSKVQEVSDELPKDIIKPVVDTATGASIALMYISVSDPQMTPEEVTDYMTRVMQPKLQTIPGVAQAQILGGSTYAMRIWLDPEKMAAYQITNMDIVNALQAKNIQSAAGATKGPYITFNIHANTALHSAEDFQNMVVKNSNGALIPLKDVARVSLGAQSYDSSVTFDGEDAAFIGVTTTPTANPLTVIDGVKTALTELEHNYPKGFTSKVVYDATDYIRASIHEVQKTIIEATLIVLIVIFAFLGSMRSVFIPVITIPLSLIGVTSVMLEMGYSLNLLTLLAMVLAIGIVVDDAIVVLENIHRHIEEGLKPIDAAIKGAREIAMPIISMTLTLAAVYAPIGFMGGLTGALFKEFAFTLAGAVVVSGIIALTLSPMMCSRLLNRAESQRPLVQKIEHNFIRLRDRYKNLLNRVLNFRALVLTIGGIVLLSCFFLYSSTKKELAPTEDQGVLFVSATGPEMANIDYMTTYSQEMNSIFEGIPQSQHTFVVNGMGSVNNVIAGMILKPWNQRRQSQAQVLNALQPKLAGIPGLNVVAFPLPSLPTGDNGLPVQFVLTSTGDFDTLYKAAMIIQSDAMNSGKFMFLDSNLKFDNPQLDMVIDQRKAASLGITSQDINAALATAFGGNLVQYFSLNGKSYQVIPQTEDRFRANPKKVDQIYIKTSTGNVIPLSTIATLKQSVQPNSLPEFQQLNSVTIQGMVMPMYTIGDGLLFLKQDMESKKNGADAALFQNIGYTYDGQSRQFVQEGDTLVITMVFALIIIFLVLAAQFESFVDPLIILISVPMSICGALIPLNIASKLPPDLGAFASINIYTQIGLITLIGLISKHGILMVEFANKLQAQENLSKREAIEKAASIRLRPILMTTAAMVFGVVPLLLANGAGAVSRFDIGIVIAAGMSIGTLFTLFMVPTVYTFLAKDHRVKPAE